MTYKLSREELTDLVMGMRFTNHAKIRITERINGMNFHECMGKLITQVLDENFGYMNTDGCINVAVTKNTYIVVKPLEDDYLVITYKEDSQSGFTIYDKYHMALEGVLR